MAGVKGRSGRKDKDFAEAVRLVVLENDETTGKRKLRRLAEKLYDHAIAGEGWAMAMIADRMDGKAIQESTIIHERSELDGMTDDEIRAFIRAELATSDKVMPVSNADLSVQAFDKTKDTLN